MREAPAAQMLSAAQAHCEVIDSLGRKLSLRRLGAIDRLRLFKAAGPVLATNPGWIGMATVAVSVAAIDDVPVPAAVTEAQVEALVGRLGDAGLSAASGGIASEAACETAVDVKN